MLFSPSTLGFYWIGAAHAPKDCVEISSEKHQELLQGQSIELMIGADRKGQPVLVPRPPVEIEQDAP